jgi:hypothetical protein
MITPFLHMLFALLDGWKALLFESDLGMIPQLSGRSLLESQETEPTVSHSPLDPVGLLSSNHWNGFIHDNFSVLCQIHRRELNWRLIPVLITFAAVIGLLALDIIRQLAFQRFVHGDQTLALVANITVARLGFVRTVCSDLCGLYCRDNCTRPSDLCPTNKSHCDAFCDQNCSSLTPKYHWPFLRSRGAFSMRLQHFFLGLRVCFFVLALPFVVWANPLASLTDLRTAKKYDLKGIKIVGFCVFCLGFLAILGGLIVKIEFKPARLPLLVTHNSTFTTITHSSPASMCNAKWGQFDVVQLAAMPLLPAYLRSCQNSHVSDSDLLECIKVVHDDVSLGGVELRWF